MAGSPSAEGTQQHGDAEKHVRNAYIQEKSARAFGRGEHIDTGAEPAESALTVANLSRTKHLLHNMNRSTTLISRLECEFQEAFLSITKNDSSDFRNDDMS